MDQKQSEEQPKQPNYKNSIIELDHSSEWELITDPNQLRQIDLSQEEVIGVDIEQTLKLGYEGKICLIQLKLSTRVVMIDTVEIKCNKLRSFLDRLCSNENIVKVFYGGQSDLLWLQRDYGLNLINYCDIRELASVIHKNEETSLVALWNRYCGLSFGREEKKKFQESEWHIRPLSDSQLKYAALDCRHLPYLRYILLYAIYEQQSYKALKEAQSRMQKQLQKIYKRNQKSIHFRDEMLINFEIQNNIKFRYNQRCFIIYAFTTLVQQIQQLAMSHNVPMESLFQESAIIQWAIDMDIQFDDDQQGQQSQNYELPQFQQTLNALTPQEDLEDIMINLQTHIVDEFKQNPIDFQISVVNFIQSLQNQNSKQFTNDQQKIKNKEKRFQEFQEKYTTKKIVYGQGKILSPQGILLCVCDQKKIDWYLKNDLATKVKENPDVIQLKFTPQGLSSSSELQEDDQFYTQSRENQCVVCGCNTRFMKFNLIPVLYKRFFENIFKSHRSHDIVLLCVKCHEKASASNDKMKQQICKIYGVPMIVLNDDQMEEKQIKELKKLAYAYKIGRQKKEKKSKEIQEMKQRIRSLYQQYKCEQSYLLNYNKSNQVKIDDQFIKMCCQMKDNINKRKEAQNKQSLFYLHGKKVVEVLKTEQDIENFIILWRKHFIETMNPQYLPSKWSIDHQMKRSFGEKSIFH